MTSLIRNLLLDRFLIHILYQNNLHLSTSVGYFFFQNTKRIRLAESILEEIYQITKIASLKRKV